MYNPLWGRFRPELRYNVDQVTLPFVVNYDITFTTNDNNYIHIYAPSDALRKIQFTMYVVVNAGVGDKAKVLLILFARVNSEEFLKQIMTYGMQEVKSFPEECMGL